MTREEDIEKAIESKKCEVFTYFLKYCNVVEAPTQGSTGGVIPFLLWPHLKRAIRSLLKDRLIVWLKSRQIGASWLIAAYCLWYTMYKRGATILLFSKGETEAIELLAKCRRIYTHLPAYLKIKTNPDSATEMGFPYMESSIKALAATETAGVSFTASVIVCDEWILHPYAARNFLQAKPCIDAGGQFIGIFTIDKTKMNEIAVQTFVDAEARRNEFTPLFDPFDVRPGRDEEWYKKTENSIPESALMGLTPDLYMLSNYPRSVDEALRTIGTAAAFDHSSLQAMQDNARQVLSPEWYATNVPQIDRTVTKIYRPFVLGGAYVAAADVGHGVGRDNTVLGIMDVKSGEIVCDILCNNISPANIAAPVYDTLKYYHSPKFFPEDNDRGRVLIEKLIDLGYKSWGYYGKKGGAKNKIGWHTGHNRTEMITGVVAPVNNLQIQINNDQGIEQMRDLIRNVDKEGRIEAATGKNDDYPMTVAILWANRKEVSTEEWEPHTISTLTFAR